jgi:hypothetical protein
MGASLAAYQFPFFAVLGKVHVNTGGDAYSCLRLVQEFGAEACCRGKIGQLEVYCAPGTSREVGAGGVVVIIHLTGGTVGEIKEMIGRVKVIGLKVLPDGSVGFHA